MKKLFISTPLLLLIVASWFVWQQGGSVTRVALVNYQDFAASRLVKSMTGEAAYEFSRVPLSDLESLSAYDFTLMFGRGLALDEEQLSQISKLTNKGLPLFIDNPTNPSHRPLINLSDKEQTQAMAYLDNGGDGNYANFWHYVRNEIDGKRWRVSEVKPPFVIDSDVLFHLEDSVFSSVEEYQSYYESLDQYATDGAKVALITTVPGPFNANRDHLDAMITALQEAGFRVYPINGSKHRLDMLKEVDPEIVIFMPHGRLDVSRQGEVVEWLAEKQIPVFTPLSIFQDYESWVTDPQGYSGGMLTMNVVLPELDGGIVPRVVNAQFLDADGYRIFQAIPERLEEFVKQIKQWLALKLKENAEKKVAIVYFRGPGKNALVAGGMEVTPSLFNSLLLLKEQGYDVTGLPEDYQSFRLLLEQYGQIFTPTAQGLIQDYLKSGKATWVTEEEYYQWCENKLAAGLCKQVDSVFGTQLGEFMVMPNEAGQDQIAVTKLQFGNVVLMPQPMAGFGRDNYKMVHGTNEAPPHSYLAAYLWLQHDFKADAVIHFGTHGSLEFTQGKQVALSENDWADALIGTIPHFYIYTMSNVGEAIIAKRRTYATILDHLTPPFQRAGLYSELATLQRELDRYRLVQGQVKNEQRQQIIELAQRMELDKDLDISLDANENWDAEIFSTLETYLDEISQSSITDGLYTWGKNWTQEQAGLTAELMLIDKVGELLGMNGQDNVRLQSTFASLQQGQSVEMLASDLAGEENQALLETLHSFGTYRQDLLASTDIEQHVLGNALRGGFVSPSSGGDPLLNPTALPTGRNMYSIDAETTPSRAAWEVGKKLVNDMLQDYQIKQGRLPEKVSFTLWPSEFIHTQGADIAQVLYLLGVEPVYSPNGQVQTLKLISEMELGRARIDVLVQSAGQLRDLAASRLSLINQAVVMAAEADDAQINYVRKGVDMAEDYLLQKGASPAVAREYATRRSFGGINGSYGTQIMSMVENSDTWQSDQDVGAQYLNNMGAIYGESGEWGEFVPDLFAAALLNTDVVIQPRSSNTWGGLSLDHVYEFMGGLSLAVRTVTGKDAEAYFSDFRNPNRARIETLEKALWTEARTTLFNPQYLESLTHGEASSAEVLAETLRNSFGWNTMKPDSLSAGFWEQTYSVLIGDLHKLELKSFFETENPYALQEVSGVMLEAARKDFWQPDESQLKALASLHADLVSRFEAGCGTFTCGNALLQDYIAQALNETQRANFEQAINKAEVGEGVASNSLVLKEVSEQETSEKTESDSQALETDTDDNLKITWHQTLLFSGLLIFIFLCYVRFIHKRKLGEATSDPG